MEPRPTGDPPTRRRGGLYSGVRNVVLALISVGLLAIVIVSGTLIL